MVTGEQIDKLLNGEIDLGLARPPFDQTAFASRLIHREDLVLAVPEGHRLTRLDRPVDPRELSAEPLIMYSPIKARYFYDLVVRVVTGDQRERRAHRQPGAHHVVSGRRWTGRRLRPRYLDPTGNSRSPVPGAGWPSPRTGRTASALGPREPKPCRSFARRLHREIFAASLLTQRSRRSIVLALDASVSLTSPAGAEIAIA